MLHSGLDLHKRTLALSGCVTFGAGRSVRPSRSRSHAVPEPAGLERGRRCPREVIAHAVRPYLCFALSVRDVEESLAERGVQVSSETVRRRVGTFGARYAEDLR